MVLRYSRISIVTIHNVLPITYFFHTQSLAYLSFRTTLSSRAILPCRPSPSCSALLSHQLSAFAALHYLFNAAWIGRNQHAKRWHFVITVFPLDLPTASSPPPYAIFTLAAIPAVCRASIRKRNAPFRVHRTFVATDVRSNIYPVCFH